MEAPNAGGCVNKIGDFRQITRYNSKTSTVASVVEFGRIFSTLSVHLCLQYVCRDAARRVGSSAMADKLTCFSVGHGHCIDELGVLGVENIARPT